MLLVPRQLQRSGMTGSVPYYGGRLTPAQAWGASHPSAPLPSAVEAPPVAPVSGPAAGQPTPASDGPSTRAALGHLRDSGVLTPDEYAELLRRVGG
jgi:hypothetical protein